MMKEIVADVKLIARCGLYCGACRAYLHNRCPGCRENGKATWCKVRTCCATNQYAACADCNDFQNPRDCKKFNNLIAKIFSFIFRSDRAACVDQIRRIGLQGHAEDMAKNRRQTIKK
jgi:hypothetical protein